MNEDESPIARRRRTNRERRARWLARQSQESRSRIRAENNVTQHVRRERDRSREFQSHASIEIDEHYCGLMTVLCQFCSSKNFRAERPNDGKFTSCCRKGRVKLEKPMNTEGNILLYPNFLKKLLMDPSNPDYKNFRENIRSYNSAVSFASMGAKVVDFNGRGPYIFKVHGQICHRTSHIQPLNGEAPQFAQLYVIDSTQATDIRVTHPANEQCISRILDLIDRFFRQHNRLTNTYCMLRNVQDQVIREAKEAGEIIPTVNMVFRRDRHSDQRRYNAPTANEIAMVFVNNDGEPPFERDIRVYPINPENPHQPFINLNILSPNLDPMSYPILFPYGEPGWQPNWRCEAYDGAYQNRSRVNVTMLQYKVALTAIRDYFNPIISAGKLTQQYIVDSYLQVEANNLNFIRMHQKKLRTELYQGLADHVEFQNENVEMIAGIPIILPSSFEGSSRNMRERCADAMSIFAKHGAPDLFITFTANPKWREITENFRPGEQTFDRPDLVARVFKIKLKSLLEDLTVHGVLGKATAHVYTVEFQKRGLPHVHILITLRSEDKFSTTDQIDKIVCAELPSPAENPRLHDIVKNCMLHGPCGVQNPKAPCMENGKCQKNFPKDFQNETSININGYPSYRRRSNATVSVRGAPMDNRYIVPYNPYLLLKYNAHINVEVCTSLRAVKYIYKYIYKGFDCANMVLTAGQHEKNEINNYIDGRYVGAPEAMWRLLESKMHDRSHAVIRLPVHLPNQQRIIFTTGHEVEALEAAQSSKTKLDSWFELNLMDPEAQALLYTDIPYHYVYIQNTWRKRQRRGDKIISRMYNVSAKDEERFYLRLLLLHVPGAISFEFLRTVDNVIYDTFKQAAFHRHLLESDEEWDSHLQEASIFQMPKQLRQSFAFILIFCNPTNVLDLWSKYSIDMALDFSQNNSEAVALNLALHDINEILSQHGLSCALVGLPIPTGSPVTIQEYNKFIEKEIAEKYITSLNNEQLAAFNSITRAIDNINENNRYFFMDGPGGSGKTYLYSTLLHHVRGKGKIALPFATTGIAATLLKGGRTVHSGFKLPVPLLETSVSSMRTTSSEAENLRQALLIIIDEITMLTKDGLRCIDTLLREIMRNDIPFGGKVIVLGGDFRQTLPVVPRGTSVDIFESCIKSSPLWRKFTHLTLTTNIRSLGQNEHNKWLLNIGLANLPQISGLPLDSIEIPGQMIVQNNLIEVIYSGQLSNMPVEELAKRVILAPTNKKTLEINHAIIQKIQGDPQTYYSADSIVSDDVNDVLNYPPEFLHELIPSGMPPHMLLLKKGVIIMLLRNLNPKRGLCNGTRLLVTGLATNFISAEIMSECNRGDIVFLPRIELAPSDINLPFILKRRQFPIIPAYAMTINKSQGQTFEHVGIYLDEPVFSHGQLYVALSRCKNSRQIKIQLKESRQQGKLLNDDRYFTQNIVFKEVFG